MSDPDPRDKAEFLVRSENRVRVLQYLAAGSADRAAIEKASDTSRVTIGRILSDFEERNWIRRHGSEYRITALGETVCEGLDIFLEYVFTLRTQQPEQRESVRSSRYRGQLA